MRPSPLSRSPILKRSTYYDPDYRQSAALIRARRPYIFKNLLTGAAIVTFAISVFAFTIKAVGQEEFADVIVPEEPRSKTNTGMTGTMTAKTPNVAVNGVR